MVDDLNAVMDKYALLRRSAREASAVEGVPVAE